MDWATGKISWPKELMRPEYAPYRAKLDTAFQQRARSEQDAATTIEASQTAEEMLAELKTQVRKISPQQYMSARRFIQTLTNELNKSPS